MKFCDRLTWRYIEQPANFDGLSKAALQAERPVAAQPEHSSVLLRSQFGNALRLAVKTISLTQKKQKKR